MSPLDDEKISVGDFLLIKFPTNKAYALSLEDDGGKKGNFGLIYPQADDISTIMHSDVVAKLSEPINVGGTSRMPVSNLICTLMSIGWNNLT